MKLRYFISSLMALVAVLLTGCSDDNDPTYLNEIRVSQSSVAFPAEGGSVTIQLTTTADWKFDQMYQKITKHDDGTKDTTLVEAPDWVTISALSGGAGQQEIILTATTAAKSREATLVVLCAGAKQYINLIQMTEKTEAPLVTVAEVLKGTEGTTYRVKGVCTSIANTTYGNWDLTDETGSVYVYGTLDAKGGTKNFASWGMEVGDIVTVEGPMKNYNGTIELVDVTVISIEKSLIKVDSLSIADGMLTREGGLISAFISCKGQGFSVEIPEEAQEWLSMVSMKPNMVTFRVLPNDGAARKTTVEFSTTDENGKKYSAQTTISQEAFTLPHGETADDPFTVAEAIAKCQEIGATSDGVLYYAKGIISSIKEVSPSYGNATFNISDDGSDENFVTVFRSLFLNNEKFTAEDQIGVGDEVVVVGKLVNYTKDDNVTPEFSGNVYIVSRKSAAEVNAPGTRLNPFTPAQAIAFVNSLEAGTTTEDDYYVKGRIIDITDANQFSIKYGNCTFYLSDDGTDKDEKFYVYRTLYLGNQKYSDDSWVKPQPGDEVVICGKLTLYNNNGTLIPETSANKTYIYSLNGKTE